MKTIWIKLNESGKISDLQAEVLVPIDSIIYVLYTYEPERASPLSKDYDPNFPYAHLVNVFCRENKRFGELFLTKEDAIRKIREIEGAINGELHIDA